MPEALHRGRRHASWRAAPACQTHAQSAPVPAIVSPFRLSRRGFVFAAASWPAGSLADPRGGFIGIVDMANSPRAPVRVGGVAASGRRRAFEVGVERRLWRLPGRARGCCARYVGEHPARSACLTARLPGRARVDTTAPGAATSRVEFPTVTRATVGTHAGGPVGMPTGRRSYFRASAIRAEPSRADLTRSAVRNRPARACRGRSS